MKKSFIVLILAVLLTLSLFIPAYASDYEYDRYEAYGLCVVSEILNNDDKFIMDKTISSEKYSEIMSFWFGEEIVTDNMPTNSDLIFEVARFVPDKHNTESLFTHFKDFGFVKKEHRDAYKKLCNLGYFDFEKEFLYPNYPLTYGYMFDMLVNFEDELKYSNKFDISTGIITDAYSEGNSIVLKQSSGKKQIEYKFNRDQTFTVQNKDDIGLYSYNVKRGHEARIYTIEDEIVYVSIKTKKDKFNDNYKIEKARIFLCNPHNNEIIFVDDNNSYVSYKYEDGTLVYENTIKCSVSDINNKYIDHYCYFIIDKNASTINYINITRWL